MLKIRKTDRIKTFILVAITLFFTLQKGYGAWVPPLGLFFLLAALYNIVKMIRKPDERKQRGIKLAIWFVVLAVAGAVQSHWAEGTRDEAGKVAKALREYKTRTGAYPANLKEGGLDEQALNDQWEIRYLIRDGKPMLVYPAPFMPLTTYEYDFEQNKWRENAY